MQGPLCASGQLGQLPLASHAVTLPGGAVVGAGVGVEGDVGGVGDCVGDGPVVGLGEGVGPGEGLPGGVPEPSPAEMAMSAQFQNRSGRTLSNGP